MAPPLWEAAFQGDAAGVAALLSRPGTDVNEGAGSRFGTALHGAAEGGSVEAAQVLLKGGADVSLRSNDRCTPLHLACLRGNLNVARLLLDAGAPLEARTVFAGTALYLAAQSGHAPLVQLLLQRGAQSTIREYQGMQPLHAAAQQGHTAVVSQLLAAPGVDADAVVFANGATPLFFGY